MLPLAVEDIWNAAEMVLLLILGRLLHCWLILAGLAHKPAREVTKQIQTNQLTYNSLMGYLNKVHLIWRLSKRGSKWNGAVGGEAEMTLGCHDK